MVYASKYITNLSNIDRSLVISTKTFVYLEKRDPVIENGLGASAIDQTPRENVTREGLGLVAIENFRNYQSAAKFSAKEILLIRTLIF